MDPISARISRSLIFLLQHIGRLPREFREALHRRQGPLSHTVGVGIGNHGLFKDRFDDVHQGMVDHPVPVWGGADDPLLGLVNRKSPIVSGAIRFSPQRLLKGQDVPFQIEVEGPAPRCKPFSLLGLPCRPQEIVKGPDLGIEVIVPLHPSLSRA